MDRLNASAVVVLLALGAGFGCKSESSEPTSSKSMSPAATPTAASPTTMPSAAPMATTAAVPEKDMTHVLTGDQPYYATSPAQGRPPEGTLKAGTKVVLVMPRGSYSQVMTADGKRVYTSTAALKPVGS